jgi:hypothetical protein
MKKNIIICILSALLLALAGITTCNSCNPDPKQEEKTDTVVVVTPAAPAPMPAVEPLPTPKPPKKATETSSTKDAPAAKPTKPSAKPATGKPNAETVPNRSINAGETKKTDAKDNSKPATATTGKITPATKPDVKIPTPSTPDIQLKADEEFITEQRFKAIVGEFNDLKIQREKVVITNTNRQKMRKTDLSIADLEKLIPGIKKISKGKTVYIYDEGTGTMLENAKDAIVQPPTKK